MINGLARLLVAVAAVTTFTGAAPASTAAQDSSSPTTVVEVAQWELENLDDVQSGRNRDGVESARGEDGDTITYTSVENPEPTYGNATAADPTGLPMPPDLSSVPAEIDSSDTTVAPPSGDPASAPIESAAPEGVAGDATVSDPEGEGTPAVAGCADFPSWYDAQIYYESAGSAVQAPELAASLDPDFDGVACEEFMQLT